MSQHFMFSEEQAKEAMEIIADIENNLKDIKADVQEIKEIADSTLAIMDQIIRKH